MGGGSLGPGKKENTRKGKLAGETRKRYGWVPSDLLNRGKAIYSEPVVS